MKLLALAALALLTTAPDPAVLQARYDSARDREERALRAGDRVAAARAHADVLAAERHDHRPASWRGGHDAPGFAMPPGARAERAKDARLAARLAEIGTSYRGWAAFWVHDLGTGAWAGWNSDASFPAASTVKLGVLAEALRRGHAPGSPLWYDLRQLAGWSSNLAANRLTRRLGGEAVIAGSLRRLGARASTYPGPYRAGTSAAVDAPKPPAARPLARHDRARPRPDPLRVPGCGRGQPLRRADDRPVADGGASWDRAARPLDARRAARAVLLRAGRAQGGLDLRPARERRDRLRPDAADRRRARVPSRHHRGRGPCARSPASPP